MGRKFRNRDAPATLNIVPKFELTPIMMYFMELPKVFCIPNTLA